MTNDYCPTDLVREGRFGDEQGIYRFSWFVAVPSGGSRGSSQHRVEFLRALEMLKHHRKDSVCQPLNLGVLTERDFPELFW
ncbi:hypothetical protein RWK44_28475 [Rhizobium sp. 25PS6]|uniref:hypothetical protein n=1 Tax=Rhizobium sp. 25PS6 TaxID=3075622 RepID=UPI0028FD8581|nr:hypothetical protein [Rhizobium sp. 25PS6]MDU0364329.1 hypothetical protein [Rhizobium sp. 25PS6]